MLASQRLRVRLQIAPPIYSALRPSVARGVFAKRPPPALRSLARAIDAREDARAIIDRYMYDM